MRVPTWLALYLAALEAERQGFVDVSDRLLRESVLKARQAGWLDIYIEPRDVVQRDADKDNAAA